MSRWAPLIYGRTYEVDYRFLAIPDDFDSNAQDWALSYIQGLLQNPDALTYQPRWGLFSNEKYCIFGVACLVEKLTHPPTQDNHTQYDLTRDKAKRSLYLFVGYVTQVNSSNKINDIPSYLSLSGQKFTIFQIAIPFIKERWLIKPYDYQRHPHPITLPYQEHPNPDYPYPLDFSRPYPLDFSYRLIYKKAKPTHRNYGYVKTEYLFPLSEDSDSITIWLDSRTNRNRQDIWEDACKYIACHYPLSLCFGLSSEKEILDSPFAVATAINLQNLPTKNRRKKLKKSSKSSQVSHSLPSENKDSPSPTFIKKNRSFLLPTILGSIGVLIMSWPAFLIGLLLASLGYLYLIAEQK